MSSSSELPSPIGSLSRIVADGPVFRDAIGRRVTLKGVAYGPFKPNSRKEPWPEDAQLRADVSHIAALGFNALRIYEAPSNALLAACQHHELRIIAGIPWTQHVDFFTDKAVRADAIERVKLMAQRLRSEPAVFALCIGNEIEKTLVRWMGPEPVRLFLEKLVRISKAEAPEKLVCYASYPSTEYLTPRNADFTAFNVFLEDRAAFTGYLQHLQVLAGGRPLVITEFGLDAKTHGEATQAETYRWFQEECQRAGIAGACWFSYTDEWHRGGSEVTGWEFGIVTKHRTDKSVIAESVIRHSEFVIRNSSFSVIVCTRNGSPTLRACLAALGKQSHPRYEVLVIDDGSTDNTPDIARSFDFVRYHRQEPAGLSAARNLGMRLAQHEILAYTDDDCIPDENWLLQLSSAFDDVKTVAAGGPNLPPPPRTLTESVVAAAPGAPSHVLLNDFEAEHLPGCNLAIRKSALQAVGGFREEFTTAGDDVDVCWRLQAHGGRLRFVPSAYVWHHRRATAHAYLRQQKGYGRAEALLMKRYPHRFSWLGGARWSGAIYGDGEAATLESGGEIHYGQFGDGLFQTIYTASDPSIWVWPAGLLWLEMIVVLLIVPLPMAQMSGGIMAIFFLIAAVRRAGRSAFHISAPGLRHRVLLFLLCLAQPVVRDWGRVTGSMVRDGSWHATGGIAWPRCFLWQWWRRPSSLRWCWWRTAFIHDGNVTRDEFISTTMKVANASRDILRAAVGHSRMDLEVRSITGMNTGISTVTEYHSEDQRVTRVAVWERPSRWLVFLSLLILLLHIINIWQFPQSWSMGHLVSALPLLCMIMVSWFWSLKARRIILASAIERDMRPLKLGRVETGTNVEKPLAEAGIGEEIC